MVWQKGVASSAWVLLTRMQTKEIVLAVDPATGKTQPLLSETDAAWLNLDPQHGLGLASAKTLPYWLADGLGLFVGGRAWRRLAA